LHLVVAVVTGFLEELLQPTILHFSEKSDHDALHVRVVVVLRRYCFVEQFLALLVAFQDNVRVCDLHHSLHQSTNVIVVHVVEPFWKEIGGVLH
jgi:hypothetical protein